MKIGDVLTIDDKNFLRVARSALGVDYGPVYIEYLRLFSESAIQEKNILKKANKGRFAANFYLCKILKKYGVNHYREFNNEN